MYNMCVCVSICNIGIVLKSCYHFQTSIDPVTLSNSAYGIVVKRSNDPITADKPVYGVRIDACICTD